MSDKHPVFGMTLAEATKWFADNVSVHQEVRVMREDDKHLRGTMDYKPWRANVHIDNSIITKVYFG